MHRSELEIKDAAKIKSFLQRCDVVRLAVNTEAAPYIVPLNYGFDYEENAGSLVFYFHGAAHGLKLDLMQKDPNVGFELDNFIELKEADQACNFSTKYESIVGNGSILFIEDKEKKKECLDKIMRKQTGKESWQYGEEALKRIVTFKLIVDTFSMKGN